MLFLNLCFFIVVHCQYKLLLLHHFDKIEDMFDFFLFTKVLSNLFVMLSNCGTRKLPEDPRVFPYITQKIRIINSIRKGKVSNKTLLLIF